MKNSRSIILLSLILLLCGSAEAQKRRQIKPGTAAPLAAKKIKNSAVVVDESLAVLRLKPSLFSDSIQRMRRGRKVVILDSRESDGVTFYRVSAPPNNLGWVQSDALFGNFRRNDDERLAKLIQASEGFEQIETGMQFLEIYPDSALRPAMLLLLGDLIEETALKLSKDAAKRLVKAEMAATGAPLHSFYLNFVSLDRYRKLGIIFLFNPQTRNFHYEGAVWREIISRFSNSKEAAEARKRLDSLKTNLEKKV